MNFKKGIRYQNVKMEINTERQTKKQINNINKCRNQKISNTNPINKLKMNLGTSEARKGKQFLIHMW